MRTREYIKLFDKELYFDYHAIPSLPISRARPPGLSFTAKRLDSFNQSSLNGLGINLPRMLHSSELSENIRTQYWTTRLGFHFNQGLLFLFGSAMVTYSSLHFEWSAYIDAP